MPGWPLRKNESGTLPVLVFPIYDADGDLVSAAAALDSERSIDQATFADCTNEAAEVATSSGMYSLAPTQAELNGDEIAFITKTSTGGAKTAVNVLYTSTRNIDDLSFPATSGRSTVVETDGMVHADLKEWLGAAPNALVSSRVDASVGAMAANTITAAAYAVGAIEADAFAAGAIDAAAIAANAIGALELATDAIGDAQIATGAIAATAFAAGAIDAAALNADAVTEIRSLVTGTADSGTSTTMVDAVRTEADDVFIGSWILFTSGAIANQCRLITEFVASSDTITFAPPTTAAVGTETYEILANGAVDLQSWVGLATALVAPNALVSGAVDADVSAMQAGVVTAAAIATDAIDDDAIATGAIAATAFAAGAIDAAAIANGAIDAATFAANALDDAAIAADAFDGMFIRATSSWEASAPVKSMGMAVMKATHRIRDNAGSLEVYRSNGTTIHATQVVTVDNTLDPVDELAGAV